MKWFFTLFFAGINTCALAQETSFNASGHTSINAADIISLKMQRRTKRFRAYVANYTQKIYGEAIPGDEDAFAGGTMIDMNRLAGYAYYHENDTNEKLKQAKKLQLGCENILRVQHFREGIRSAVAVMLQIAR
jgi:hypothetical protein